MSRCNPYGYATDAGPRHVMGGRYGPEYAGHNMLVDQSGLHGLGFCEQGPGRTPADAIGRFRMVCVNGHATGDDLVMQLCRYHVEWISARYLRTCTRCAMPPESIALEESMNHVMREMQAGSRDIATLHRLQVRLDDLRHEMDELIVKGIIRPAQAMKLVEVS